jgi:PncC family amidohydrolase
VTTLPIDLATRVVDRLRSAGATLSVAESCTGGMIGATVTAVPGSSDVFLGGTIAYADGVKMSALGVAGRTLDVHGAVSGETVAEMAQGVARAMKTDYALSVSGVAGPGGGTAAKPVGLVWIGLRTPDTVRTFEHHFEGDRDEVRERTVAAALGHLLDEFAAAD